MQVLSLKKGGKEVQEVTLHQGDNNKKGTFQHFRITVLL